MPWRATTLSYATNSSQTEASRWSSNAMETFRDDTVLQQIAHSAVRQLAKPETFGLGSKSRKTSCTSWRLCSSTLGGMGRTQQTRAWASATRVAPRYHAALRARGTARLALSPSLYLAIQNGMGRGLVIRKATRVSCTCAPRATRPFKTETTACTLRGTSLCLTLGQAIISAPGTSATALQIDYWDGACPHQPSCDKINAKLLLGFLQDQYSETSLSRCIPDGTGPEEVARFC
jgi:hypothetical protein